MEMNKKLIVTLIGICFLTTGVSSSLALSVEKKVAATSEKYLTKDMELDENASIVIFQAYGPVRKITEFEFLSGSDTQIQKINKMLSKRFFYPIIPVVFVKNLTFNITFTEPVKNRSRNWYATAYSEMGNLSNYNASNITTIINKPHSYTVKNFTGIFTFIRPKLFRLFSLGQKFFKPYRFTIVGVCENISENIVVT